jgi:chromosome segregation ATPase
LAPGVQPTIEALTAQIESAEQRIAEIDAMLADSELYRDARSGEVRSLGQERTALASTVEHLMGEWESLEDRADRTDGADGTDGVTRATSDSA